MYSDSGDLSFTSPSERLFSVDGLRMPHEPNENNSKSSSFKKNRKAGFRVNFNLWGKKDVYMEEALANLKQSGLRRYSYMELQKATEGFNQTRLIGRGGCGNVYKGSLKGGRTVAIKVSAMPTEWIIEQFTKEIEVLTRLHNPNLIKLLGWCKESNRRMALVYEYMPNGSLDSYLHSSSSNHSKPSLPWVVRYSRIVVGLASALLYLQDGLESPIVHRDIKPGNVLLDSDFNPKLGDFGISKTVRCDDDELETTAVMGTPGYLDPQYLSSSKLGKESDIYAFGVVAMQIASGRKAIYRDPETGENEHLPSWVQDLHQKGRIMEAADPSLHDAFDKQEMERLLLVGLGCTQLDPKSRPSMEMVLRLLNFQVPMPSDFSTCDSNSLQRNIEEKGMMPDFLADVDDYETVRYHLVATSSGQTELILTSFYASTHDTIEGDTLGGEHSEHMLEAMSSQAVFDIGIPSSYSSMANKHGRKAHQDYILKGFVNSLKGILQSEEGLPRFDEALETIKRYTESLVLAVGPPLDDWNELAQLILHALREKDEFLKFNDNLESLATNLTQSSLISRMNACILTIKDDDIELEGIKGRLARARLERDSLVARLREVEDMCLSTEEEVKAIEERIECKRRCSSISDLFESIDSKLQSITCDK